MKRRIATVLLLALALSALWGCGGAKGEQTAALPAQSAASAGEGSAAPASVQATAHDWSEPDAVDDSYTDQFDDEAMPGDILKERLLPNYLDRWVENGQFLHTDVKSYRSWSQICWYGWICFTGTPKTELGWRQMEYEGQRCFCRSVFLRAWREEDGLYHLKAAKSVAMEPVKLNDNAVTVDGATLFEIRRLEPLTRAELYVPSLGKSFVMTDPAALEQLRETFSQEQDLRGDPGFHLDGIPADPMEQEGLCPLYLDFEDGGSALMLAAGDGADFCIAWGLPDMRFGPESVFERFGVPLEAAGYSKTEDGGTLVEVKYEGLDGGLELHYTRTARSSYDARGRLVRYEERKQRDDWDRDEHFDREIFYLPDGKLDYYTQQSATPYGDAYSSTVSFLYNEKGWLIRMSNTLDAGAYPGLIGQGGYYYDYSYDEEGRLLSSIYHYADGSEGRPSGNSYYWYDENGQVHAYGVDEDGNLTGGPEDAAGDNPLRR